MHGVKQHDWVHLEGMAHNVRRKWHSLLRSCDKLKTPGSMACNVTIASSDECLNTLAAGLNKQIGYMLTGQHRNTMPQCV